MKTIATAAARFAASFALLRAAARAAGAVEAGRKPRDLDLRALGIDPRAFAGLAQG